MDGEETLTPRGRSQRVRRKTKQYEGTITWEEAHEVINKSNGAGPSSAKSSKKRDEDFSEDDALGGDDEEDEDDENGESAERGSNAEDQYEDGSESADALADNMSLMDEDEGDGNTSDEFVPEEKRPSQGGRKGKTRLERPSLGSDSEDEEFGSSFDGDEGEETRPRSRVAGDGHSLFAQQAASMSMTRRLERAKQRRASVAAGHGGMEAPSDWRVAGLKNRRAQREEMQIDNAEAEVEVEVEGEELQHLADIFADEEEVGTSIAQVERWQSALHDESREEVDDEELDEEGFDEDMRTAAGFRRRSQRDKGGDMLRRRAPREQALSAPVRALISEANIAFIEPDLHKTIAKMKEVIKLEPAVRAAWATLALCFQELGEEEKALQSRIMEAHLTSRPIALWEELAAKSREMGYNEQAIYCLSKAITSSREKDRVDVLDIMWERGQLLEEMNKPKRAAQSYMHMLQYRPQNQSIIRQIIPLLFQLDKLDRAIEILQRCEEWNMACFPDPHIDPAMMDDAGPDDRNTYESSEVVTLADLLLRASRPLEALHTIRRGARWLDGRGGETYWDDILDDDREFDETRDEGDREDDYGRRVAFAPIHYLEPEFRFLLGVARARLHYGEEAARHFEIWQSDATIQDELEHYSDMAEEYMRLGQNENAEAEETHRWFDLALRYTNDTINERQNIVTDDYDAEALIADYKRLAACYAGLGDSREAIVWLKEVIKYTPDDYESTLRLAEAYEETGDQDTAIQLVTQVVKAKRDKQMMEARAGTEPIANDEMLTQSLSFFAEMQQRATRDGEGASKQSLREKKKELERIRELESSLAWKRLKSREEKVFIENWWSPDVDFSGDSRRRRYGDRESHRSKEERFNNVSEWLSDAERLVTMFQSTPQLYPRNRTKRFSGVLRTKKKKADMVDSQASAILARLGDDVLEEGIGKDTYEHATFRGIKLEEWVTLIMQYAFVLTKVGEYDTARAVVDQCIKSNVIWSDDKRKECMQLCLGSCALYAQDFSRVIEMIRTLTNEYQFHNEPLRMLLTLGNSTGSVSVAVLSQPHNLKYFLRRSRIHEAIAQGRSCKYKFTTKRWVVNSKLFGPSTRNGKVNDEVEEALDGAEGEEDDVSEAEEEDVSEDDEQDENPAGPKHSYTGKDSASGPGREVWETIKNDPAISEVKAKPPTRYDPANDMLYASLLLTSTNGVPSMGYWTRVFAKQQTDPLICLSAAISCLGRAQNRQVDNRHQVIIQAFSYLHHYRQIRMDQGHCKSEVAYNFGRAFHLVGLYQLAVPHYEQALQMYEEEKVVLAKGGTIPRQTGFRSWPEAAYNLSLIYLNSGNALLANQIVERYLQV